MHPQDIALKLTEIYFNTTNIEQVRDEEFPDKKSSEVFEEIYTRFFKTVADDIFDNQKRYK